LPACFSDDLAIVGISEEAYSYVQRLTLKGGELGEMQLDRVSTPASDSSTLSVE
jgi:hypothetical protein